MKNAIYCTLFFCMLNACSSVPVSEQITEQAKSEINAVESVLDELEYNLSKGDKNITKNDLIGIKEQIKEVKTSVDNINNACKTEKQVLKETISTKNWLIVFLVGVISTLIILLYKKR